MQTAFSSAVQPISSHILAHSSLVIIGILEASHFISVLTSDIVQQAAFEVPSEWPLPKIGAITNPIKQVNLIKIFIDGPEVSLNGSPTVSPVTAALWASDPL